jgi:large subunit ribosomal protein L29
MSILKYKEIEKMKKEELINKVKELRMELAKERSSAAVGGTVKNPGRLREIRRTIARIKTYLNQNG